jgi:phosphonopyruvate decarboxylase
MLKEKAILNLLDEYRDWYIISDVGKTSREIWEHRKKGVFVLQGAMGHSLSISLGLALNCPSKRFLCVIGDSALLMKLGTLATIFDKKPKNLHIVVLNNNCNDSTGGQPTSFEAIRPFLKIKIIDVEKGSRNDLTRPTLTCKQIANEFRKSL